MRQIHENPGSERLKYQSRRNWPPQASSAASVVHHRLVKIHDLKEQKFKAQRKQAFRVSNTLPAHYHFFVSFPGRRRKQNVTELFLGEKKGGNKALEVNWWLPLQIPPWHP